MATDKCSSSPAAIMDNLWFYRNILFFEPTGLSLQSMATRARNLTHSSSCSKSSDENRSRHPVYKEKMPPRLDIVIGQPLFQLQTPTRCKPVYKEKMLPKLDVVDGQPNFQLQPPTRGIARSQSSSPSLETGLQRKYKRMLTMGRRRSLSELENYELKGFMDLGFVFHKDELNPHMMSMLPGLQRLKKTDDEKQEEKRDMTEEQSRRPYLSEAWLVNRPDSPLLNLSILPNSPDGADVKRHLQFWARSVASLVHEEF